ncbi:MAG TPA: MarR family transcriptional regulator [Gaiellaceae bacterium]|jgi:DNA-binding MarR family transcriptional regulator
MPERDAIDRILEQWRRERPELDASPMAVIGRIYRLDALLSRSTNAVLGRQGLTGAEFDVLASLRRAGAPFRLTPTGLGRSLMADSGTVTHRLDRLEERGLIRRHRAKADRRSVEVALTARGRKLVDVAVEEHVENERRILEGLSGRDREQLIRLLRKFLLTVDRPSA